MKILEDKEKTVKLFIKNLLCGTIRISHSPTILIEDRHEKYLYVLNSKIGEFQHKPTSENIDFIYSAIARLRVFGILQGEFITLDYDKYIEQLKEEIHDQKLLINQLLNENDELKSDNIRLAEELNDRTHIINTFENTYIKKDDTTK